MARRKNDTLKRKEGCRRQRDVCWVSTEGRTEKDYLGMDAFKDSPKSIRYPENVHPHRRDQILEAVANAEVKRAGCKDAVPAAGMTDAHLLVKRLLG